MVGVAQSVERQVVALDAAGSSPVTHPIFFNAPVAQLDRAPDFESVGRPFESGRAYQIISVLPGFGSPFNKRKESGGRETFPIRSCSIISLSVGNFLFFLHFPVQENNIF